ncbi:MAG: acyl-CoA dehydrogenase [Desulfobacterales bacterium]|nr:acyl-CoA dehydrogenase [Desulfobacterales bacterium]MCP4158554.1 acyl-CoA dehydrogenase [Deltaproteobacteria bacterium]
MAQLIADRRDVDFVLFEQLKIDELSESEKYKGMGKKMFDMVITEARNFAIKEILPLNEIGDKEGLKFENNMVKIPEAFRKPYEQMREGGWIAMMEDIDIGGQGLPYSVSQAALEYIVGADFSFGAFGFATHGAAKMIEIFGTDLQKNIYMDKMYSGEWGGTMVLTESEAGSDVGALTTTAKKNDDGTYTICGNKIFITCGEHDLTPNIVHPVLARIEGAPSGTKGISLFLVPKIWVNDDGSMAEANDVVCTGIEEKMGLHASPTCQLAFGSKGNCRGVLLGEENKGMKVMFHMMNEARLGVGALGLFNGSCAYLYGLDYARQRKQGRDLSQIMDKDAPSVAIINHPDIRRELMWMKTHVEGMRSLVYYIAHLFDKIECEENEEEKSKLTDFTDLLTPIVKSYCSDKGFDCCVSAMQIYGGYGYTADYPVERLLRDSKINSIYEGTNGIQAMDLIGRKLGAKGGASVMDLFGKINETIKKASEYEFLKEITPMLEEVVDKLGHVALNLGKTLMSEDLKHAFSQAKPFLDVTGDVIMAWMLLWRAEVSAGKLNDMIEKHKDFENLKGKKGKEKAFYEGQIYSARYYIETILPKTLGQMNSIDNFSKVIVDIPDLSFGG